MKYGRRQNCQNQHGAVLVIALLIVAIITALAVDFSTRFQLSLGRAENRFFSAQMQQSLLSLEHAAMWAMKEDKKEDKDSGKEIYDHLAEQWASSADYKVLIEAEFEDVLINELVIEDAQARFNINQLANRPDPFDANKPFDERYTAVERRFIRLLQTVPNGVVGLPEAEAITQAVVDWLDPDNNITGSGGAESDYYLSQEKPFRAANDLMATVSELRLIKGMTEEAYEWLLPLVVALPDNAAGINVNTALPQVLQSLNAATESGPITEEYAEILQNSRPVLPDVNVENEQLNAAEVKEEGFSDVGDFLSANEVETVFGTTTDLKPDPNGLTTGSSYFFLIAEVEIDKVKRRNYSLLKRDVDPRTNATSVLVLRRGSEDIF